MIINHSRGAMVDIYDRYTYENEKKEPVNNREFWTEKLQGNIERDRKVNKILETQGWKVLRFWDTEILNNLDQCLEKIEYELGKTSEN